MKRLLFIIAALFATAQSQTIQTIGAPTTTVVSRGNFRTDSIFYLPKRQRLPTDSGAVRYQISDSSVYYWSGFQWRRLGVHIDTAAMLLPYLRDADTTAMLSPYLKESDTVWLSNRINLKVNIADTSSMLDPYLRGSGTANYLPKFNASRSIIDSKVYETGTNLMFNTTTPSFTSAGISTIENNATSSAVYTFKTSDSLRAYIGWGGASTMDINNLRSGDIRFYTAATLRGRFQTDGTFRLNSLTGTGSRIVVADANGVLSATSSATGLVDTTVVSTRDWRKKGDDSLGAIIATKGSGTVTSVATGYGLSGGTITTTGTIIADTLQLSTRAWRQKGLDSLASLEISGSGTTNYVPKFTGTGTIGNSLIFDNGSRIGIGTTSPTADLDLRGGSNQSIYLISTEGSDQNNSIESYRSSGGAWSSMLYRGLTHQFLSGPAGGPLVESGRFTSSNELLLNTTTDAGDYKLQVNGNAYVTGTTVLAATGANVTVGSTTAVGRFGVVVNEANGAGVRLQNDNNSSYMTLTPMGGTGFGVTGWANSSVIEAVPASTGGLVLSAFSGATIFQNDSRNEKMRIAQAGNVGINITNPGAYTSDGNILVIGNTGSSQGLTIATANNGTGSIYFADGTSASDASRGFIKYSHTSNNLQLGTNAVEKIRIHTDGGLRFIGQSAAPTAEAGTVYYDSDDNKLKVYNGTTWVDLH